MPQERSESLPEDLGEPSTDDGVDSFENRVVAYVDILGFSAVVKDAVTDKAVFDMLRDALTGIEVQVARLEADRQWSANLSPAARFLSAPPTAEMTAFSDCYLISEVSDRAWTVFAAVQALGAKLLARDILTRGAIVRGNAYHNGRIAFGPAILEAYDIERNVASYPRIVVTDGAREAIHWENENLWRGQLLRQDIDGCSFINIFTPPLSRWSSLSALSAAGDMKEFLTPIRSFLEGRLIRSRGDLRIMAKTKWLVHQFNLAATAHGLAISEKNGEWDVNAVP